MQTWLSHKRQFRRFVSSRYSFPYQIQFEYPRNWGYSPAVPRYDNIRGNQTLARFLARESNHRYLAMIRVIADDAPALVDLDQWLWKWKTRVDYYRDYGDIRIESCASLSGKVFSTAAMETTTFHSDDGAPWSVYKRYLVVSAPWKRSAGHNLLLYFTLFCSCDTEDREALSPMFERIADSFCLT